MTITKTPRSIIWLSLSSALQALALIGLISYQFTAPAQQQFQQIDVKRINLLDEAGQQAMVIASRDHFPAPIINGQPLEVPRSVMPSGVVFYDSTGSEAGGVATATQGDVKANMMIFDYRNSEAIGFNKFETDDAFSAHFVVMDRLDTEKDMLQHGSAGSTRVRLGTANKHAELSLHDTQGKPRIRLVVGADDNARIQLLNAQGDVVLQLPEENAAP